MKICVDEIQISKDIKRTKTPDLKDLNVVCAYQESLRSILRAYANLRPNIGYIQGMNIVVSCLLMNICTDFTQVHEAEEESFKLFVTLMDFTNIGKYYENNMETISELTSELRKRVQNSLPKIYWHIITNEVV